MKMFRRFCGNRLESVIVVTARWDEVSDPKEAEEAERSLQQSDGFLKRLNDASIRFFRTGHFNGHPPEDGQYHSPIAIVEQLLGLDSEDADGQDQTGDSEGIQESKDSVLVLTDDPEPSKQDISECMEDIIART